MATERSDLYFELLDMEGTRREHAFEINGVRYGPEDEAEVSHLVTGDLFDKFSWGNAVCAKLSLEIYAPEVPAGAEIKRFMRLVNGDRVSEWIPAGVFYANRRPHDGDYWQIEAFDRMRKAEKPWEPRQDLNFPLPAPEAVDEFCRLMGCKLDPRTQLRADVLVPYPTSDPDDQDGKYYTIRKNLQWIAAAHGGNWIFTGEGDLYLVPFGGEPKETFYLVTEHGNPIEIGELLIYGG